MGRLSDEMRRAANQPQSADGEKHVNTARHSKLTRLIQIAQTFQGFLPMELEAAAAQATIWDRFGLHVIPDDDIADAFTRAVENIQDGETAFGAPKVLAAWQSIRRERAEAKAQAQPNTWHRGDEVTFAEWFAKDHQWVEQNLTPEVQAMMQRLFDKRVAVAKAAR